MCVPPDSYASLFTAQRDVTLRKFAVQQYRFNRTLPTPQDAPTFRKEYPRVLVRTMQRAWHGMAWVGMGPLRSVGVQPTRSSAQRPLRTA